MKRGSFDQYLEEKLKGIPGLQSRLEIIGRAIDIAFQIYTLREKRGITQLQLASIVGTSQSNIARLENADYSGYSLKTLEKIAAALEGELKVCLVPKEENQFCEQNTWLFGSSWGDESTALNQWAGEMFAPHEQNVCPQVTPEDDKSFYISSNSNKKNSNDYLNVARYAY